MLGLNSRKPERRELDEVWHVDVRDCVIDLAWSPCGRQLAFLTVEGGVHWLEDVTNSRSARNIGVHSRGGLAISWRHDSRRFATAGQDGLVRAWDISSLSVCQELPAGAEWVERVAYHPRRDELAGAAGRTLRIWDARGIVLYESGDHASTIADIGWNPDGSAIACAAYNGLSLHVPGRRECPRKYSWKGSSLALAWSPTARYIATGEQDSTVHFWNVRSGEDAQMWGFPTKVRELAWSRSGDYLATGGGDTVVIWDCSGRGPQGRKPLMLEGHPTRLTQLAFQRRGDLLASGDADGFVMIWDPLRQHHPVAGRVFPSAITRLAWSPDERQLVIGQQEGVVALTRLA